MRKMKWSLWLWASLFVAVSCTDKDDDATLTAEIDRDFAMSAAETNLMGLQSGQLVEANAKAQSVKNYGVLMSKYYESATKDLAALAKKRNISLPATLGTLNHQEYTTLSGLQGARFDSAYIDWAVRSNKKTIETLQTYRSETKDNEFQNWVDARLTTLQDNQRIATTIQQSLTGN
jgi:putative membrane protein